MYAQLDPSKIIETIARLKARIHDRFPDADLGHVCAVSCASARPTPRASRAFTAPTCCCARE
jgi:hypothetical protein